MAALIGLVIGALIGGAGFGSTGAAIGGFAGFFVGAVIASRRERDRYRRPDATLAAAPARAPDGGDTLAQRVVDLERRVGELERVLRTGGTLAAPADQAAPEPAPASELPPLEAELPPPHIPPARSLPLPPVAAAASVEAFARSPDGTLSAPSFAPQPAAGGVAMALAQPAATFDAQGGGGDTGVSAPPNPLWAWMVGGNTLARIGVLLLFIGVGFLLKYAVEHVYVPMSVRLAGVALGGVVLLVLGWRLRHARRAYAMVLQGGGVGVLYLTVFAALRLYAMVSPVAAFVLLLWISGLSSFLAVRQDAISLAALAVVGGFLAPILTSSQSGNHVLLFSYYALLNVGILGIAWFKAWRPLNLLGFVFTFLVGTFWGVTRYRPENFATTEPFLILFFVFYVAIAVLYALRRSVEVRSYVDAGLVFGTPLVAAGLQSALVRDIEYAMAWSALAMGALYLVIARILWHRRRDDIRLLIESFLALGVVLATLAIPLGLDARWTSAAWAVEGAAILWAGVRQRRTIVRVFGLLLQLGAGVAFMLGLSLWAPRAAPAAIPVVNSAYVGAVLVALAGLYSAWLLQRSRDGVSGGERDLAAFALGWGALWWVAAGWREIERFVAIDMRHSALVAFLAATAVLFAIAERRLCWPAARVPALLLLPTLFAIAAVLIARSWESDLHLFAHGGALAWPIAIAVVAGLLRWFDRETSSGASIAPEASHAGLFWLVLLVAVHETAWAGGQVAYGHNVWTMVPWGIIPALAVAAVSVLAFGSRWPIGTHRHGYLVLGSTPVVVLLVLWSLAANVHGDGDPAPLVYAPFFNPLDLTQAIVLVACATWIVRVRRDDPGVFDALPEGAIAAAFSALVFLWINAIALRTIHFWFDVPYTPHALWHSTLVQAVLSLLWSSIALATMVYANRRQWRTPWIAGATLLGVVVAKLFAVELSQVGTVTRIVSFIGVGLLLLLIGYLAPVPPRRTEDPR